MTSQGDPTFFPETVIEGQVDSDYVIYGFASSFCCPQWVPEKKQKNCHHCKDSLKTNCTHNCRLCGNVFCSHCTGKYHLPEKYDLKQKQGPTRVCYGCKMSCIRMRQAALNLPLDSITRILKPPQWQDIKSYIACNKCCIKRRSPHNCRLCGNLYCDDCSTKMPLNLPPAFNIKKKLGPQRVCDGCRFRVIAGARIDDGTQHQIQSFLLRQQSMGSPPTLVSSVPEFQNETGPIGSNYSPHSIQSPYQTSLNNEGIKIIYTNTNGINNQDIPHIPVVPLSLPASNQHHHNVNGITITEDQHTSKELSQITASLNSLSIDSGGSDGGTPRESNLNNLRYQYNQIPTSSLTASQHRSQRYGNTTPSTPSVNSRRISTSSSTEMPPHNQQQSLPPPSSTGEQLQHIFGGTSASTQKKRPVGGRDIYRALSTVQPSYLPIKDQKLQHQQSLDDQKEGDMDDEIPPPPPLPIELDHSSLVKPSQIFNKLKTSANNQNNTTQPAYLQEDNYISNHNNPRP